MLAYLQPRVVTSKLLLRLQFNVLVSVKGMVNVGSRDIFDLPKTSRNDDRDIPVHVILPGSLCYGYSHTSLLDPINLLAMHILHAGTLASIDLNYKRL